MQDIQKNNEEFDWSSYENTGRYNNSVKISDEDKKAGLKIMCKEPYAQELYDKMKEYEESTGVSTHTSKDLVEGGIYRVTAKQIAFDDQSIWVQEDNSGAQIEVPFKEFSRDVKSLMNGENLEFNVMVIKGSKANEFVGSEKRCVKINHKQELNDHLDNNDWFEVKVVSLIKGGYIAKYKDSIDCFIPGSHAAANIIRDFNKLIGKTINVMVDNYDSNNDLFILSYKKYIQHSMQYRVSDLEFGRKYTGTLTAKPYDFGIFVEFDDYFTGLIHSTEFENYNEIRKTLKPGDNIDFYIKNVTKKGKQYRVVLTMDPETIDSEKKHWSDLRDRTQDQSFEYEVDSSSNSIKIHVGTESYEVTLKRRDLDKNLSLYPRVKVSKVDPINKNLKFEFVSMED
jgi:predicted RNA-binding protein with RPS1 domain